MIYVPKPAGKVPRDFLEAARAEWQKVEALPERRRASYPFGAYRHRSLKDALEAIFGKKCAYCESQYEIAGYLEVEHYRPKKLYYWLAADWSNLLPACKRCNNGKLAKFPLADPATPARRKGDEQREAPLLLNPSDPSPDGRPERHLRFNIEDGSIQATVIDGKPSAKGLSSIEVYRLTRTALVRARKSWALRVRAQLLFSKTVNRRTLKADQKFLLDLAEKAILDAAQPYRALTRQIMRESRKRGARQGR